MEEGLVLDLFKHFARKSTLNPLSLYEMTIYEATTYLNELDEKMKQELDDEIQIIRLGVASALSGKNVSLFENERKNKANRVGKEYVEREIEALGEI